MAGNESRGPCEIDWSRWLFIPSPSHAERLIFQDVVHNDQDLLFSLNLIAL